MNATEDDVGGEFRPGSLRRLKTMAPWPSRVLQGDKQYIEAVNRWHRMKDFLCLRKYPV
jgi:hypothetical protein